MTVQLASLKATLDGAEAFVARTAQMALELDKLKAATAGVAQGTGQLDAAIGKSVSGLERLKRQTIEGYAASRDFYKGIQTWETALSKGRATTAEAERGLIGLVSRYKMLPEATELASRGITQMANIAAASQERMGHILKQQQGLDYRTEKANQWADRLLPAQFTDIVVGAASGQSPMMILLQQGGQIKDMYGGVGNALKAVGSYALGLVNPFTVAGAAVGVLAFAFHEGTMEAHEFTKALALTGNYAGMSVNEMYDVARAMDNISGTTKGAVAALTAAAGTGKITGANLRTVATAAEEMRSATGRSVDDTVAEFARIADDPVKAIEQLNETMHFLNAAEMEHIRTLVEHGDKMGAASIATDLYAGAIGTATAKIREDLGLLERAWNSVGRLASEAWDAMENAVRPDTVSEQIAKQKALVDELRAPPYSGPAFDPHRGPIYDPRYTPAVTSEQENKARIAEEQRKLDLLYEEEREAYLISAHAVAEARARKEGVAAAQWLANLRESTLTNSEKRERDLLLLEQHLQALRRSNPNSADLDPMNIAEQRRRIEERYKDPVSPAAHDDAATKMLIALKEREASLRAQSDTTATLTEDERKLVEFNQTIADLKGKTILTAAQKSYLLQEQELRSSLELNAQLSRRIEQHKTIEEFRRKAAGITVALESGRQSRADQYDRQLAAAGLGNQVRERTEAIKSIYREYNRQIDQFTAHAAEKGLLGSTEYKAEIDRIQRSMALSIRDFNEYYQELDRLNADWRTGASRAVANFIDDGQNVAALTEQAFTNAFSGAEDALVSFVRTGKADFKSLADSIIGDVIRIATRIAITNMMTGGGGGDGLGAIFSAISSGMSFLSGTSGMTSGGAGGVGSGFAVGGGATSSLTTDSGGFFGGIFAGLASGGPAAPGGFYEVNEKGPELYTVGSRTYLMAGGRGGYVTPVSSDGVKKAGGNMTYAPVYQIDARGSQMSQAEFRQILEENNRAMKKDLQRNFSAYQAAHNKLVG